MFDQTIVPLVLVGCPILAVTAIGCLICCKGKGRRYLAWTAAVFLGTLALLFVGEIVLGFFDLTWRDHSMLVLCGTLLVSGWVGIVFTLACALPMEWPKVPAVLRGAAKALIAFLAFMILMVTLWFGPLALLFIAGNEERVVNYQGQTLLEVDDGFLDPHYSYYEYHGPLVRGTERVYDEYEPLH